MPPLRPMLAKAIREIPTGDHNFEPKWDGFRCIVFRDGDEVVLGSRNEKPLTRYFPELIDPIRTQLPQRCVVDGEIVVATPHGLEFDLLGQRIHPADSRVQMLARETPASLVVFDLLAVDDEDVRGLPLSERRERLEQLMEGVQPPIHLTPVTKDPEVAADWFERFEGAGFDGIMAKPTDGAYVEDKRVQFKVKHHRTADCVVAGFRHHKDGGVGSLLLGLFADDADGTPVLHHVGVCSAFSAAQRRSLVGELAPLEDGGGDGHPWRQWSDPVAHEGGGTRMPGAPSRWSGSRSLEWVPLRCERVVEVTYENLTGMRFRHPARFVRWRPDKDPADCRYDQLEHPPPVELYEIFPEVGGPAPS